LGTCCANGTFAAAHRAGEVGGLQAAVLDVLGADRVLGKVARSDLFRRVGAAGADCRDERDVGDNVAT
jgi:hypothetical protein